MIDFEFLNFCAFFSHFIGVDSGNLLRMLFTSEMQLLITKAVPLFERAEESLPLLPRKNWEKWVLSRKSFPYSSFYLFIESIQQTFGCAVYKWRTIAYCKSSVFVWAGSKISSSTAAKKWESECWAEKVYHLHHSSLDAVSINNNFFAENFIWIDDDGFKE